MALAERPALLRIAALHGAMLVAAVELFAAQGPVAGSVGIACVALGAGAGALERRTAVARLAEWSATALAAHVVLGMAAGLYERSALYDKAAHLVVSFGLARLAACALERHVARQRLRLGARLERWIPVLAVVTLGTAWELFEFATDATGLVLAQRGLADTMLDLAADTAGALAAAAREPRATFRQCARSFPASSTGRPSTRRSALR